MSDSTAVTIPQLTALEAQGRFAEAAAGWQQLGELARAALCLHKANQPIEAGDLYVRVAGLDPATIDARKDLPASFLGRDALMRAAACYAKGRQMPRAIRLFALLDEIPQGVSLLRKLGEHELADKVAAKFAGRTGAPGMTAPRVPPPLQTPAGVPESGVIRTPTPMRPTPAIVRGEDRSGLQISPGQATPEAAQKLERGGHFDLAIAMWLQLQRPREAADVAARAGDLARATDWYQQAGAWLAAARLLAADGRADRAVLQLLRVKRSDPDYRDACVELLAILGPESTHQFEYDNFLSSFLASPPRTDAEVEAMLTAAWIYHRAGMYDEAMVTLDQILRVDPQHPGAHIAKQRMGPKPVVDEAAFARVLRQDAQFRAGGAELPVQELDGLPDLPDLPDLPPIGGGGWSDDSMRPGSSSGQPSPGWRTPIATRRPDLAAQSGGVSQPPPPVREARTAPTLDGPSARLSSQSNLGYREDPRSPSQSSLGYREDPRTPSQSSLGYREETRTPSFGSHTAGRRPSYDGGAANAPTMLSPEAQPPPAAAARSQQVVTQPPADVSTPGWTGLQLGSVLAGRYLLEKQLGVGGMATVFAARDQELDESVAIKVFGRPGAELDAGLLQRFKAELSVTRRLVHPNIIRVYDFGNANGLRYITMEMLRGKDLDAMSGPAHPPRDVLRWLRQAALGLGAAHEAGIVHRDVKPHNLFLCDDGTLKVMDFGIAKQTRAAGMTVGNYLAGTPEYMSPEQIGGFSDVTASTDLYALGVVAFQLLTGRLPFEHTEMLPLMMMHINQEPPKPRSIRSDLSQEIEDLVLSLLSKRPEDRPNCAGALVNKIDWILA